jgi:hypothetical protein
VGSRKELAPSGSCPWSFFAALSGGSETRLGHLQFEANHLPIQRGLAT